MVWACSRQYISSHQIRDQKQFRLSNCSEHRSPSATKRNATTHRMPCQDHLSYNRRIASIRPLDKKYIYMQRAWEMSPIPPSTPKPRFQRHYPKVGKSEPIRQSWPTIIVSLDTPRAPYWTLQELRLTISPSVTNLPPRPPNKSDNSRAANPNIQNSAPQKQELLIHHHSREYRYYAAVATPIRNPMTRAPTAITFPSTLCCLHG